MHVDMQKFYQFFWMNNLQEVRVPSCSFVWSNQRKGLELVSSEVNWVLVVFRWEDVGQWCISSGAINMPTSNHKALKVNS